MRSFLKYFLASIVALLVFSMMLLFSGVALFKSATDEQIPEVKAKTVLVLDLSRPIMDQRQETGISFPEGKLPETIGLYDVTRAIQQAAVDTSVKGIYLLADNNESGFATSTELRQALAQFRKSGKFVIAYGSILSQRAYEVALVSDRIFVNPMGRIDWKGYGLELIFFKNAFEKLELEPEIFYAGQFKSATEPYRLEKMSEANRLQLSTFLNDHHQLFTNAIAEVRSLDTSVLNKYEKNILGQNTVAGKSLGLVDGIKYDDEVKEAIAERVGVEKIEDISFMRMKDYIKNGKWRKNRSGSRIAVIYAEGEIVDGEGGTGEVGGRTFRNLVRKARMNEKVKAIVLRINSPGGSVLASEEIRRELALAKEEKPVVVSMGNYAASGGYYIAAEADTIFAQENTLTGSIGVFSMFFDASKLLKNKLGITTDEVVTAPSANMGSPFRPLSTKEKEWLQADIDSIYHHFINLVSNGRGLTTDSVTSLAAGRVWSGKRAVQIGLADHIGGMDDAISCAAKMAGLKEFSLFEYPEVKDFWEKLLNEDEALKVDANATSVGVTASPLDKYYTYFRRLKSWVGVPQMRLPFFVE